MRVAILSDVHANLPAFEAALDQAKRWGAEEVVVLGDLVGAGPHPKEVVDLARKRGVQCLAGAMELAIAGAARVPPALREADAEWAEQFDRHAEWTAKRLTSRDVAWLKGLPRSRRVRWGGRHVLLAHATMDDPWRGVPFDAPDDVLAGLLDAARCDVLVTAHAHAPEVRALADGRHVLNPGSMGVPSSGPEGTLILADFEAGTFKLAGVPFDVDAWQRDRVKAERDYLIVSDTTGHSDADGA